MKTKGLLVDFIIDNAGFILVYFLNTIVLLLFFYLYYENVELAYPICLSSFLFFISIIVKWFKYKGFNKDIDRAAVNAEYKISYFNREQERTAESIHKLHLFYRNELSNLKVKGREDRRLISQFVHSLKAPVTVIDIAVSDMLETEDDFNAVKEGSLSDIKIENEKITSTLDNLLSLLRLDEFEIDYTSEAINLEQSLNNIINSMKRDFIYGRVVPKIQCRVKEPIVYTDEKWNRIMLRQFISNGIKYSLPEEGMKPLLFIIDRDEENVTLTIRDEGIGIPEYDLDRVTEAFFTGENGRKVKNSSGIGLYIAKKISQKLNHKIDIKSKPLTGTEIKITYLSKM